MKSRESLKNSNGYAGSISGSIIGVSNPNTQMVESSTNARTRKHCFRGLVEVCGKYGVLPASHTILESKIETLEDAPVSAGEFTEVWPGMFMEDDGDDDDDAGYYYGDATVVAIKVVRYLDPDKAQSLKRVRRSDLSSSQDRA